MATPTDKREELTALFEYSSILCAKAIKKQHIAVPEHKQRRPKILEVSICAFSTVILLIFYCDVHDTGDLKGGFQATKIQPKYAPGLEVYYFIFIFLFFALHGLTGNVYLFISLVSGPRPQGAKGSWEQHFLAGLIGDTHHHTTSKNVLVSHSFS